MQVARRDSLNPWMTAGGLAGLAVLFAVVGGALLYRSQLAYPINYNEGWNSYMTARVLDGAALYPDRSARIINNYPPLSFFVAAGASKLGGGVLTAGRAVAWSSFFGCGALIGLLLLRMACTWAGAAFGGLFFLTVIAVRCDLYVGMFDPQFLGQLVMLCGLLVLVGAKGRGAAAVSALLIVAGGFVKHSLIALPVSAALWLAWCHRGLFWTWVGTAAAAAGAGLAGCAAVFGPEFLAGLAAPRRLDLAEGVRKVLRWLLPIELPCALATLPCALGGDAARFVGLYLVAALGSAVLGASPSATNYNMIFELLVAVSLGLGLLVGAPAFPARVPGGWVALAAAACLWVTAAQLATAETSSWRVWSGQQVAREARAKASVAALRAQPGPALCSDLLLCFLAGKPFAYDPLNVGHAPGEMQEGLQQEIAARRFGAIQFSAANLYFSQATLQVIGEHYALLPGSEDVLVPIPVAGR